MQGIVVGCDLKQEWLLSWWWKYYSLHNSYPVAFFDLGMSSDALAWCRERGNVYSLPSETSNLKAISSQRKEKWEKRYGEGIFMFRTAWFKKPLALLLAPFDVNCWMDLDCQVMGSIKPLFESLMPNTEIALGREPPDVQKKDQEQNYTLPGEISYNSGVIVFRRNADFLHKWAAAATEQNDCFLSDQTVLSRLIYLHDIPVAELPLSFNWLRQLGPNPDALIIHYVQSWKLKIIEMLQNPD